MTSILVNLPGEPDPLFCDDCGEPLNEDGVCEKCLKGEPDGGEEEEFVYG